MVSPKAACSGAAAAAAAFIWFLLITIENSKAVYQTLKALSSFLVMKSLIIGFSIKTSTNYGHIMGKV